MDTKNVKRVNNFSLVELLIVITIMSVAAGGLVTAYGSYTDKAESAQNTSNQKRVEETVRTYTSLNGAPDELDSLVASADAVLPVEGDAALIANINEDLSDKLEVKALPESAIAALNNAGISTARYVYGAANINVGSHDDQVDVSVTDAAGVTQTVKDGINHVDNPNQVFDYNATGTPSGRGAKATLSETTPLAVWKPGLHGSNTVAVGAFGGAHFKGFSFDSKMYSDLLIAFGLGNNATIAGDGGNDSLWDKDYAHISTLPTYIGGADEEYGRYILLYNVGNVALDTDLESLTETIEMNHVLDTAILTAVVDAHGNVLN